MKTTTWMLLLFCLLSLARPGRAATIEVTNLADSGAGTLRKALAKAADGDTIKFNVTGTIRLTTGELLVTKSVTILGPGPDKLSVDGNAASRVFNIAPYNTVSITGLTIANGYTDGAGGGIYNDHSSLTLSNCILRDNSADGAGGGGIYNYGYYGSGVYRSADLTVNACTFSGNSAGGGGNIFNYGYYGSATLKIVASTFSGNSAESGAGGGIKNFGTGGYASLAISASTFNDNAAFVASSSGRH